MYPFQKAYVSIFSHSMWQHNATHLYSIQISSNISSHIACCPFPTKAFTCLWFDPRLSPRLSQNRRIRQPLSVFGKDIGGKLDRPSLTCAAHLKSGRASCKMASHARSQRYLWEISLKTQVSSFFRPEWFASDDFGHVLYFTKEMSSNSEN